ncbi:MAG: ABC transporter ATP-binding protein, partial [Oscillospiraceae bacterium]
MMTSLSIKNGCFSYKGERTLFHDVSFQTEPGDIIAILGPNGAGKTTLLRCLMGFLHLTQGESFLNGQEIRMIPQRELWRHLAYVPQAKNTVSAYTAEEMILLGRSSRFGVFSHPRESDLIKAQELMEKLGIEKLSSKKCSELSGGELQMILMARALAGEPQILILDEPESNLDFKNQLLILETMSHFAAEGMSCIFNTHYPAHALQRANKALLLDGDGACIFGDARNVITEKNIEWAFGVEAVIREIEADGNIFQNVVPLRVAKKPSAGNLDTGSVMRRKEPFNEKLN